MLPRNRYHPVIYICIEGYTCVGITEAGRRGCKNMERIDGIWTNGKRRDFAEVDWRGPL